MYLSYAARELAFVKTKINDQAEFKQLQQKFDNYIELDFLKSTFVNNHQDNVFYKSGFIPYKTICAYIWIKK